jgi:hypothetical protein
MRTTGRWLLGASVPLGRTGGCLSSFAVTASGSLLALGLWCWSTSSSRRRATTGRRCRSAAGWPTISGSDRRHGGRCREGSHGRVAVGAG